MFDVTQRHWATHNVGPSPARRDDAICGDDLSLRKPEKALESLRDTNWNAFSIEDVLSVKCVYSSETINEEEEEVEETNGYERHANWPHLKIMALLSPHLLKGEWEGECAFEVLAIRHERRL